MFLKNLKDLFTPRKKTVEIIFYIDVVGSSGNFFQEISTQLRRILKQLNDQTRNSPIEYRFIIKDDGNLKGLSNKSIIMVTDENIFQLVSRLIYQDPFFKNLLINYNFCKLYRQIYINPSLLNQSVWQDLPQPVLV